MPELPDVEVFRRHLDSNALGRRIGGVTVRATRLLRGMSAQALANHLVGRRFGRTQRHGKYLFVSLERDGVWLVLHFGMTGSLRYSSPAEPHAGAPEAEFAFDDGSRLIYSAPRKLGRIGLTDDPADFVAEKRLGPDALDIDLAAFRDAIAGSGAIKPRLMNQEALAGIGNLYGDEILFQARIHPRARAEGLSGGDVKRLHRTMRDVLERAIAAGADPERMPRGFLLPRRTRGGRCPRCGGLLERTSLSGRTSWLCPACQKR